MRPIIIERDQDGNAIVSVAEFKKMLNDAYDTGYADGSHSYAPAWWQINSATTCDQDHVTISSAVPL